MKIVLCSVLLMLSVVGHSQNKLPKIGITHLVDNIYVHTSHGVLDDKSIYPANGLFIITAKGIVLIDTPWGEEQTQQLIDTLATLYHKKIILCISTHFHDDRTGGVDVLKKHGIKTYSSRLTRQLAISRGDKQPEFTFTNDTTFTVGGLMLQTYFPGEAHTRDNIVVWFPKNKVLFGGCFIKSLDSGDIGNIADANVKTWPASIKKVEQKYKDIRYVIPGHLGWQGDTLQLTHTLALLKQ